ncbi:MAG: hypothetical protein RR201_02220 [Malacoplasma sp.]
MIDELQKKINNNNFKIINDLVEIMLDKKIITIDELKLYQENNFKIDGNVLSDDKKVEYCIKVIENYPFDYDFLDFKEIQIYKRLMIELKSNISLEIKIKNLIIIYSITKKEMLFPFYAYDMILKDIL